MPTVQPHPIACLRDQRAVRIRAATARDRPRIAALLRLLDRDAGELELFRDAGGGALVAETPDGARVVGCAASRPLFYGRRAEAGFAVAGDYRTSGLARVLLVQLARTAAQRGIPVLVTRLARADRELVDDLWDEFRVRETTTLTPEYAELVLRHGGAERVQSAAPDLLSAA